MKYRPEFGEDDGFEKVDGRCKDVTASNESGGVGHLEMLKKMTSRQAARAGKRKFPMRMCDLCENRPFPSTLSMRKREQPFELNTCQVRLGRYRWTKILKGFSLLENLLI